ncbi:MAG TPA: alpha/beta fold hydrolase [Gammaproteobacteria bacterium]|nr:alpha/beta fold hydrolase [Gammaproteobacteria bacterium]
MLHGLTGCSGIFFFPQKTMVQTPDRLNLDYEDIYLESTDNVTIHGWWLKAKTPLRGTVYFLHGNAENISTHIHNVAWLPDYGYQVFLLDYRGFGSSQGKATLPGALQDIGTGFQFVLNRNADLKKPVYLLGQSLGASMAIYFAATDPQAKQNLSAIISDAAFTRYSAIARYATGQSWLTWLLQYPVSWSVIRGYDPVDYIGDISPVPLLLIHSKDDPVIPYAFGQELMQAARPPKTFLTTNGPHTATFNSRKNREFLLEFLANTGKQEAP